MCTLLIWSVKIDLYLRLENAPIIFPGFGENNHREINGLLCTKTTLWKHISADQKEYKFCLKSLYNLPS